MSSRWRKPPDSTEWALLAVTPSATAWIVVACLIGSLAIQVTGQETELPTSGQLAAATPAELSRWVTQLDADDYLVRRDATEQLIRAGSPAAAPVGQALVEASVEQLVRGLHVLHQLALSGEERAEREALRVLEQLANNPSDLVRNRAAREVDALVEVFQDRALVKLQQLGVVIGRYPESFGAFLAEVPKEFSIRIDDGWQGTPADLEQFRWLRDARTLWLSGDKVTDEWVPHLSALRNVQHLRLYRTPLSDQSTHQLLSNLPNLMRLDVWYSDISDRAFPNLTGQVMWHKARLYGTPKITEAGLQRMKRYANEVDLRPGGGLLGVSPIAPDARQIGVVQAGSAADKAGLLDQDVIRTFDGIDVQDFYHLTRLIGKKSPNETAQVGILRDGRERLLPVVLGAWSFDSR